ncbi:MAG: agmatinase [Candidatus Kapabacteria bacterium]|jgi:agmatinase|nr:agmatinase [Candidatus Kapabacteria bacterium]
MKYLNEEDNFLAIEDKHSNYQDANIVILPAPYEHTVSYGGGTNKGPEGIINASAYVEFYDNEFDRELCFDKGICTLESIEYGDAVDKAALDILEIKVSQLLNDNKFVVTLGGEHTISTAPIAAHLKKYPNMSVLQFDAHSDLRETYEDSPYSHACIMARVAEFLPYKKITQVGIRALCIEESVVIKKENINTFFASAIRTGRQGNNWQKAVCDTLADEVYITFDVDYFDPSIMPSTGTPEPDGFLYNETLDVFREMIKAGKKIVGFDIVESAPVVGVTHPEMTVARLLYKMLNFAFYEAKK